MAEETELSESTGVREIDLLLQSSLNLLELLSVAGDIVSEDDTLREECLSVVALLAESALLSREDDRDTAITHALLRHCAALASATLNPSSSNLALAMISPES